MLCPGLSIATDVNIPPDHICSDTGMQDDWNHELDTGIPPPV